MTILDCSKDGAIVQGTSHIGDRLQAELELYFVHIDENFAGKSLFEPVAFLQLLRALGVFHVGRAADGSPLQPPQHLLRMEREENMNELVD